MKNLQQHHSQWAKTKSIPPKIRNKTGMFAFTTLIQHSSGSPSHSDQTRRRNKRHPNWKGRSKTVIIRRQHDRVCIVCIKNPIVSTKILLDLISEFRKVVG